MNSKIFEEKLERIDFSNESIKELRMTFLRGNIELAKTRKASKPDKKNESALRGENVCRKIVDELLDEKILLSDANYVPTAITEDEKLLLKILINNYVSGIANWLEISLRENKRRADKVKYDGKEFEEITWRDLDQVLRK